MRRAFVYRSWSPEGDTWRAWVKPVLFAALDEDVTPEPLRDPPPWLGQRLLEPLAVGRDEEHPYRQGERVRDTAIVVDLPGATGAELGVALAHHGFRPVPLYNAVPAPLGTAGVVDVRPIMQVFVDGAHLVRALPDGLPPAFLLDADRMGIGRALPSGAFDNRSMCRAPDFPSAQTLLACGIRRVVLVRPQPAVNHDLHPILLDWQRHGIAAWEADGAGESDAVPVVLRERSWFQRLGDFLNRGLLPQRADGSYGMTIAHGG